MKIFLHFLSFFFSLRIINNAKNIPEEKKEKHKTYAIVSIILSIIAVGLVYPSLWAGIHTIKFGATHFLDLIIIGALILITVGIWVFFIPIYFAISSLSYAIGEMKVNRKPLTWIAFFFSLIAIVATLILGFAIATNAFDGKIHF